MLSHAFLSIFKHIAVCIRGRAELLFYRGDKWKQRSPVTPLVPSMVNEIELESSILTLQPRGSVSSLWGACHVHPPLHLLLLTGPAVRRTRFEHFCVPGIALSTIHAVICFTVSISLWGSCQPYPCLRHAEMEAQIKSNSSAAELGLKLWNSSKAKAPPCALAPPGTLSAGVTSQWLC